MKALNIFFIFLFTLSAALQFNDPDPYLWVPIYLYGAMLCYLAICNKYNHVFYLSGLIVYGIYALYLFIDQTGVLYWLNERNAESIVQSMKASKPWIEETREFIGLLLLMTALSINMLWLRKKKREPVKLFSFLYTKI